MCVWKMFYYSPKKFSALKEMQALFNHPQLKMIKPSDTRWLVHDRSVKAIMCSMRPLIDTLEHIHEDTGEPEALGMLRTMKTYNFVATLIMLSDVFLVLTCLSRTLQAKTPYFTLVASQLTMSSTPYSRSRNVPMIRSTFPQSMTQSQTLQLVL